MTERVHLAHAEKNLFRDDLHRATEYYLSTGMEPQEAFDRIGDGIFGDFFREPAHDDWYPLDSAAKIYPLSMTRDKMAMFRISAHMAADVVPCLLQLALNSCIRRFPIFATTLKRGLFWHYLDARRKRFTAEAEELPPCTPLKVSTHHDQVFRLLWFRRRISLEVFHCVTDGGGAMPFFKALIAEYLRLLGNPAPPSPDIPDITAVPDPEEFSDAFAITEKGGPTAGYGRGKALQISGKRSPHQPAQVIHFIMPAGELSRAARECGTTVGGLALAAMFLSARAAYKGKERNGDFKIQLPVDMRRHYSSKTLRNFSMYAIIKIPYDAAGDISRLIPLVNEQLRTETSRESLDRMAEMTRRLVNNPAIKYAPLGLKKVIISGVKELTTGKSFTGVLSNLGRIPTDFGPGMERFSAVSGPSRSNQTGCALVSYGDTAVLSVTKHTSEQDFEATLYDTLASMKIPISVEGNRP